jgi:hypothetical protein
VQVINNSFVTEVDSTLFVSTWQFGLGLPLTTQLAPLLFRTLQLWERSWRLCPTHNKLPTPWRRRQHNVGVWTPGITTQKNILVILKCEELRRGKFWKEKFYWVHLFLTLFNGTLSTRKVTYISTNDCQHLRQNTLMWRIAYINVTDFELMWISEKFTASINRLMVGGNKLLWNVGQYLPDHMVQHLRIQPLSYSST